MGEQKRRNIKQAVLARIKARLDAPEHRMPPCACLGCGKVLDAATVTDGSAAAPHPGAVSVCFDCGYLQVFADDLSFRNLTDDEMVEIAGHPEIVMAGTALKPWKELYEQRHALSEAEIEARALVILRAMVKADWRTINE
jgi:hypothetical protein